MFQIQHIEPGIMRRQVGEQGDAFAPIALSGLTAACMIDQDLTHQARGHADEVRAILPLDALQRDQSLVSLIDQRGRLQGMFVPLAAELAIGERMQLVIQHPDQPIPCGQITAAPSLQKLGCFPCHGGKSTTLVTAGGKHGPGLHWAHRSGS